MTKDKCSIDTLAIHSGERRIEGSACTPIFQSSTYEYRGGEAYNDIRYLRLNNSPNHDALHIKLAALESAEDALVTASGMAAIASTFLTCLSTGDHVLVQQCPYGGTHSILMKEFSRLGIGCDFIDTNKPESWESVRKPSTKMIYVEAMSNPMLDIPDFAAVIAFARKHKLVSVIDNTFASPINFQPLIIGFDLSVHSATKYLNGHSDIVAGAVIGRKDLVTAIKHNANLFGGTLDPHACFLLQRGIKTLAVRVRQQNESTLEIARFLEQHGAVKRVYYPGLESHPQHSRALELFRGSSGVVSFELKGGKPAAEAMISRLKYILHAPSLGGVESLITCPGTTTHALMSEEEKRRTGLSEGIVRLSVGLESASDLMRDLESAMTGA